MYMGEVNVAQEELNSFLSVAEDLRVKGLTQNNSDRSNSSSSNSYQETYDQDLPENQIFLIRIVIAEVITITFILQF